MKTHRFEMPENGVKSFFRLVTAVCVLFTALSTSAQDWEILPELGVGFEIDDNARLSVRTDEEIDLRGVLYDARVELGYMSPNTNFTITPRLRWSRYSDNPEYDADDLFTDFGFAHQTQSSLFRLRGRYARENIRTAERDNADFDTDEPDDIIDDGTGVDEFEGRREKLHIRPSWDYDINEYSRFVARLDYTTADYDEALTLAGLRDYSDSRLRLRYERDVSNRNTAIVMATGRSFDSTGSSNDTTGVGVSAGFARSLSSSTKLEALVGLETTDEEGVSTDPTYTVDVSLVRRLEVITLLTQYRRSVSASGQGNLMARDSLNFRLSRELNDRISAGLGFRAYRTDAIEGLSSSLTERDYVQLRAVFSVDLTQAFQIETDYRYTFIRRTTLGESANSNNVNLWLTYRPRQSRR